MWVWIAIIFIVVIFAGAIWQGTELINNLIGRVFSILGITWGGCALTGIIYILLLVAIGYLFIHFAVIILAGVGHFLAMFFESAWQSFLSWF